MAKKIEVKEETTQESTKSPTKTELLGENPHSAFSVVKTNGRYSLLRILLNAETNVAGEIEVIKADMGKEESQEVFKINVAREIFMRQG